MDWSEQHVCVTGGAGFIGSHLVDALCGMNAKIRVIDDLCRGRKGNICQGELILPRNIALERTDLQNEYPYLNEEGKKSVVFHLAALVTGIQYNIGHNFNMMQSNLEVNTMVAKAACLQKPKLLVWVSTACIYPHDAPVPTPESCGDACNPEPTNFGYGVAKWVGEQQAKYLCLEYGIPTIIVRFFNAFGPRDYYDKATSHVAPALIRRVMEGENPLNVWGSGKQTRVLVDARDIAKALVMLAEQGLAPTSTCQREPWIVNIGHSCEISIGDLATTIVNMAADLYDIPKPEIVFDTSRPDGYPRRSADTAKLQSLIDWLPDTPLEDTLADMFKDYIRQRDKGWIDD